MFVGVVEHTCHNAVMFCEMHMWKLMAEQSECYIVSCYTFPWVNIQLFSVSVICIETVFRFNCYDLRAFCLPFLVCIQAKQGQYFLDGCSLKKLN